jgi:hypothetical protein
MRTSMREIPLSLFPITKTPDLLTLLTGRALSPDLSPDPPVAGLDASGPPAVSPTARIEEMILR